MGLFSKPTPPSTISDKDWAKVQRAAARAVPPFETPGADPAAIRKMRLWDGAPKKAASN